MILVVVFALYVAVVAGVDIPGLTGAFRAEGAPISPEAIARGQAVERKINDAVEDKSAFILGLTDAELTDLLLSKIDPETQIRDAEVNVTRDGEVKLSGSLNGRVPIGFSGAVDLTLEAGKIEVDIQGVSLGFVPLPGAIGDQVEPLVNDVLDINKSLLQAGATEIQQLVMEEGKVTIVGIQQAGETVSQLTTETFLSAIAAAGDRVNPTPPGADLVPPGRTGGEDGPALYLIQEVHHGSDDHQGRGFHGRARGCPKTSGQEITKGGNAVLAIGDRPDHGVFIWCGSFPRFRRVGSYDR